MCNMTRFDFLFCGCFFEIAVSFAGFIFLEDFLEYDFGDEIFDVFPVTTDSVIQPPAFVYWQMVTIFSNQTIHDYYI